MRKKPEGKLRSTFLASHTTLRYLAAAFISCEISRECEPLDIRRTISKSRPQTLWFCQLLALSHVTWLLVNDHVQKNANKCIKFSDPPGPNLSVVTWFWRYSAFSCFFVFWSERTYLCTDTMSETNDHIFSRNWWVNTFVFHSYLFFFFDAVTSSDLSNYDLCFHWGFAKNLERENFGHKIIKRVLGILKNSPGNNREHCECGFKALDDSSLTFDEEKWRPMMHERMNLACFEGLAKNVQTKKQRTWKQFDREWILQQQNSYHFNCCCRWELGYEAKCYKLTFLVPLIHFRLFS